MILTGPIGLLTASNVNQKKTKLMEYLQMIFLRQDIQICCRIWLLLDLLQVLKYKDQQMFNNLRKLAQNLKIFKYNKWLKNGKIQEIQPILGFNTMYNKYKVLSNALQIIKPITILKIIQHLSILMYLKIHI